MLKVCKCARTHQGQGQLKAGIDGFFVECRGQLRICQELASGSFPRSLCCFLGGRAWFAGIKAKMVGGDRCKWDEHQREGSQSISMADCFKSWWVGWPHGPWHRMWWYPPRLPDWCDHPTASNPPKIPTATFGTRTGVWPTSSAALS